LFGNGTKTSFLNIHTQSKESLLTHLHDDPEGGEHEGDDGGEAEHDDHLRHRRLGRVLELLPRRPLVNLLLLPGLLRHSRGVSD
jgi:hypothetical protein